MWLTPILSFIFFFVSLGSSQTCITTGGSDPQKSTPSTPCTFPFVHENMSFDGCTTDKRGRLWCSTKVDDETNAHIKGNWGFCPSYCIKSCAENETCTQKEDCPLINSQFERYKAMRKDDPERPSLRSKLRSLVCHQKTKKMCCPFSKEETVPISTESPVSNVETPSQQIEAEPIKSLHPPSCQSIPTTNFLANILPSPGTCGLSCNTDARVARGADTKLGEFPWAALLGYRYVKSTFDFVKNKYRVHERYIKYQCGGTLINTWYVLTAAHCHQKGDRANEIYEVVLGEWEVSDNVLQNKDPDCAAGSSFCYPKVQKIAVDWVTNHADYSRTKISVSNDIALVRLKREAVLNTGVQLGCLPLNPPSMATRLQIKDFGDGLGGYRGTVIGWGHIYSFGTGDFDTHHVAKAILQKATPPFLSVEECQRRQGGILVNSDHLCAGGGEDGADFCKGDSGGGIFIKKNTSDYLDEQLSGYVQVGIVSFGSSVCGQGNPGVYTRVNQFMSWIIQNLEP